MSAAKENIPAGFELNRLFSDKLRLFQQKQGYRFSVDAVLLSAFAINRTGGEVIDFGTGNGIVPVILSRHEKFTAIFGMEVQEGLVALAQRNVSFNDCGDRVRILQGDIRQIRKHFSAETFDAVIMNPPFYAAGSGRISPDRQNAAARHEVHGTISDFLTAAAYLLKQKGRLVFVYNPARLVDLLVLMRACNIEPKTLQFVHGKADSNASMVLGEGVKASRVEAKVLAPLIMYGPDDRYTAQAVAVFNSI